MNNHKTTGAGIRIKQLRTDRGLTQSGFARMIGRNFSTVSKLESGRLPLSGTILVTICTVFGVRRDWLLNGTGPRDDDKWALLEKRALELGEEVARELARLMSLSDAKGASAGTAGAAGKAAHGRSLGEVYAERLTDILGPDDRHRTQTVSRFIDAFFELLKQNTHRAGRRRSKTVP